MLDSPPKRICTHYNIMIDDLGCVTVLTMYLFTCYADKYLAGKWLGIYKFGNKNFFISITFSTTVTFFTFISKY